jgi:hypothetical protein
MQLNLNLQNSSIIGFPLGAFGALISEVPKIGVPLLFMTALIGAAVLVVKIYQKYQPIS